MKVCTDFYNQFEFQLPQVACGCHSDTHSEWQEIEASLKLCAMGTLGVMTPEAYLGKGWTYNHQSLSASATVTRRHKNKIGLPRRRWASSSGRVLGM